MRNRACMMCATMRNHVQSCKELFVNRKAPECRPCLMIVIGRTPVFRGTAPTAENQACSTPLRSTTLDCITLYSTALPPTACSPLVHFNGMQWCAMKQCSNELQWKAAEFCPASTPRTATGVVFGVALDETLCKLFWVQT